MRKKEFRQIYDSLDITFRETEVIASIFIDEQSTAIQDGYELRRKDSGFDVTDKIEVIIFADGMVREEIATALDVYKEYVSAQTLALSIAVEDMANASEDAADVEWDEGVLKMELNKK